MADSHPGCAVHAVGGKRIAHAVEIDDLGIATHDPLLASLRQQEGALRKCAMGLRCVFLRASICCIHA